MPRRLLSLPLLIMFAMSPLRVWATSECAHLVAIGAGEVPYQWPEDRPQGAHVGLLNRVATELGVTVEFLVADSRQQAEAEADSGRVDLLVGTERRPELVGLDFLLPPLYQTPLVAWVPGERAFAFHGPEDLQGRRGLVVGEIPPLEGLQLAQRDDFPQAVRDLLAGAGDYVLFELAAGQAEVLRHDLADRVEILLPAIAQQSRYLALSHSSACYSDGLRERLTKALERLEVEGAGWSTVQEQLGQWVSAQDLH